MCCFTSISSLPSLETSSSTIPDIKILSGQIKGQSSGGLRPIQQSGSYWDRSSALSLVGVELTHRGDGLWLAPKPAYPLGHCGPQILSGNFTCPFLFIHICVRYNPHQWYPRCRCFSVKWRSFPFRWSLIIFFLPHHSNGKLCGFIPTNFGCCN